MSFPCKRKKEIDERDNISGCSRSRIIRGSQVKQIKYDFAQDTIEANHSGWVTTEAALRLGRPSMTTLEKLATTSYNSSPFNKINQNCKNNKNLHTQIGRPRLQGNFDHNEDNLIPNRNFERNNHIATFEKPHCSKEIQTQNLAVRLDKKRRPMSIGYTNCDSEAELVDNSERKIPLKNDKNIRNDSISSGATTLPASILNSKYTVLSEAKTQVFPASCSLCLVGEQNFIPGEIHDDDHSTSDIHICGGKENFKMTHEEHFHSEKPEIDEFDEGLNDTDFFAVISDADQISTESNDKRVVINLVPYSSLSIPSNNNQVETNYLANHLLERKSSKQSMNDELSSPSTFKDIEHISEESRAPENLNYLSDNRELFRQNNECSTQEIDVASQQINWQTSNQAHLGVKDEYCKPFITEGEDWDFLSDIDLDEIDMQKDPLKALNKTTIPEHEKMPDHSSLTLTQSKILNLEKTNKHISSSVYSLLDDVHEYKDPGPFARSDFPSLVEASSPIIGLSSNYFLRVCFRIREMINEAEIFNYSKKAPLMELFARVTYSYRECGTCRQFFQFSDMWQIGNSFVEGILANYEATELIEQESKEFIFKPPDMLARVLGTMRKDKKYNSGWLLYIINIRETDWEEINWTKKIVNPR